MKTTLASLEADFVEFKQNTNKSVLELNALLTTKDEKILKLEKEINDLKSAKSQNQQTFSDFTVKQLQMEEQLKIQHSKCKCLEQKNTSLLGQISQVKENLNEEIVTLPMSEPQQNSNHTIFNIPTSNQFEKINDEYNHLTVTKGKIVQIYP